MKARPSGAVIARVVRGKGRLDPTAVQWAVAQLRRLGLGRCILQADGEPSQRVFTHDIIKGAGHLFTDHLDPLEASVKGYLDKRLPEVEVERSEMASTGKR